ncbi:MAG: hypothetical protein QNL92_00345, partial [Octadecabacter sp.]
VKLQRHRGTAFCSAPFRTQYTQPRWQALAAAALAGPCFNSIEIRQFFHVALTRPDAMLAFDTDSGGLMVLDPYRNRLFYAASDIW